MTVDRTLARETLAAMLYEFDPAWELRDAETVDRGHTSVHHVEVGTPDGPRRGVLKATPDGESHGLRSEPRLLAMLDSWTGIPVPTVRGAVDAHPDLPAPYFLMDAMPGTARPFQATRHLDDGVLRRLARETGAHLAELHGLDAADAFGVVGCDPAPPCDGGRPTAAVEQLGVTDGREDWPGFLRATAEPELDGLEGSRFADLAPAIETAVTEGLAALRGPFEPVLGRIDHGVHNLLFEPATGAVRALIDWGFVLAATPGYDLRTVEYVLSGAVLAPLDDATDRRPLVREALRSGYREVASYPASELADHGELYELLAVARAMNHLEDGLAKVPAGSEDVVAAGLREDARRLLG